MPYKTFLILTGVLLLINFLVLKLVKGKAKVFVKKTNWYTLGGGLLCALLGLSGLLVKEPAKMQPPTAHVILQALFLGLGVLHAWLLFKIHPWASREKLKLELLYTTLLMLTCALWFFAVFAFFEKGGFVKEGGFADNLATGLLLLPLPLLAVLACDRWLAIPRREVEGWTPPFGTPPIAIVPGNSIRLALQVPARFQSEEMVKFDTLAPRDRTLGEMFYYLLHRHNIADRSPKKIEIAENKDRSKTYQWLFFIPVKRWWWMSRRYLHPDQRIGQLDLPAGATIFAARVRPR